MQNVILFNKWNVMMYKKNKIMPKESQTMQVITFLQNFTLTIHKCIVTHNTQIHKLFAAEYSWNAKVVVKYILKNDNELP